MRFPYVYRTCSLEHGSTTFEFPTLSLMSEDKCSCVNMAYVRPLTGKTLAHYMGNSANQFKLFASTTQLMISLKYPVVSPLVPKVVLIHCTVPVPVVLYWYQYHIMKIQSFIDYVVMFHVICQSCYLIFMAT